MYSLERTQSFPIPIEEAWDFFSSPENLKAITPGDMGFDIVSVLPGKVYAGMIITYRIKPLFNIPLRWITEITHVREPHFFIDHQLSGPYRFWHHQHHFSTIPGGTEMTDILHYAMPFGVAGRMVHFSFIGKKIEEIFDYRHNVLAEHFGKIEEHE